MSKILFFISMEYHVLLHLFSEKRESELALHHHFGKIMNGIIPHTLIFSNLIFFFFELG